MNDDVIVLAAVRLMMGIISDLITESLLLSVVRPPQTLGSGRILKRRILVRSYLYGI